jgi:hypothetical protein
MAEETSLNSQIVDSVGKALEMTLDPADEVYGALTRSVVAQAMGQAVQNAVAQVQSLQTLEVAVNARAASLLIEDPEAAEAALLAVRMIQATVQAAVERLASLRALAEAGAADPLPEEKAE